MSITNQSNELKIYEKKYESLSEEDLEDLYYGKKFEEKLVKGECELVTAEEFLSIIQEKYDI